MTTLSKHKSKPFEVEVFYDRNRVTIRNVNSSYIAEFINLISHKINEHDTNFMHLMPEGKKTFFLLFGVLNKLKRLSNSTRTLSITIPEGITLYQVFSMDDYIGTILNYTADLIQQKLS